MQALADLPAELSLPFERIFETAGIVSPSHGWNLARLQTLLHSASRQNLDRAATQRMLLDALSKDAAPAEDLVREAIAQDQALDAFETLWDDKMGEDSALLESRLGALESRIHELEGERAQLRERLQRKQEKLNEWRRRKRAYERELASTIGYLTDHPCITTEGEIE
jgi:chromosome segregation ATPase